MKQKYAKRTPGLVVLGLLMLVFLGCESAGSDGGGTTDGDTEPDLTKIVAVLLDDVEIDGTTPIDFGDVILDESATKTVVVQNTGTDQVSLTDGQVELSGTDASQFGLDTTGTLTTLPAGEETSFGLSFSPVSTSGTRSATLTITSDAEVSSLSVGLQGRGGVGAQISAELGSAITDGGSLSGYTVSYLSTETLTITVSNNGDLDLVVSEVALTGDIGSPSGDFEFYFDPVWTTPLAITPGDTRDLILKIINRVEGDLFSGFVHTGDVGITSNSIGAGLDVFEFSVEANIYY